MPLAAIATSVGRARGAKRNGARRHDHTRNDSRFIDIAGPHGLHRPRSLLWPPRLLQRWPRYYGASPYVGGTQIDRFDEHRGEGRGRYEGRE